MSDKIKLEQYLRTTPAIVGNEAIDKADKEEEHLQPVIPEPMSAEFLEIGSYERGMLVRLQNEPGHKIVMRMLNNIVLGYEKAATLQSQGDPLGDRDGVANAWAYVAIARRIKHQLEQRIAEEIAQAKR